VPLSALAVGAVVLTTAAVALVAHHVIPDLGWAAAFALGAIVAPPEASIARAVLRKLGPPHRLLVVLEGESLFNDATALIIYRTAVGTAVAGAFSGWRLVPTLLLVSLGSVIAGYVLARIQLALIQRIKDIPINVMFQFIGALAVWMLAEHLWLSPIITIVTYAMMVARRVGRMPARHRIASIAVWDVVVLILNVVAFMLVGLQLRGVVSRDEGNLGMFIVAAAVVCATVIAVRVVWVMAYVTIDIWRARIFGSRVGKEQHPTFKRGIVASWCGMRGIVSLAAALALPNNFPHRNIIVFCAFSVVLTTLVLQGLTLVPLTRRLKLRPDMTVENEVVCARIETARAALETIEQHGTDSHAASELAREYKTRLRAAEDKPAPEPVEDLELRMRTVDAQHAALTRLRARREIGDDAFHAVEEEIDLMEFCGAARDVEESK
jgi:CPA1 family monovalent cation:H+ antiporter